ncbi:hypothetical protein PENTCL1PPCAC_17040, partial [Pristionchus entomophagus]
YAGCYFGTNVDAPGIATANANLARQFNTTYVEAWLIYRLNDDIAFISKVSLIIFDVAMVLSLSLSITLASSTFYYIKKATTLSSSYRSMQMTLLKAVSLQTLVPFICICIPYFYVLNIPFFNVSSPSPFLDFFTLLHALFPTFDSIIIIALMKPYRDGLLFLLMRSK